MKTIDDVVAGLQRLDRELPAQDGVACFARLYLKMTEEVGGAVQSAAFADPSFMTRLDVLFATRFFDALDRHARGTADVPHAWRVLFEARQRAGVSVLQFALAGMNAHINFDLALALVDTCEEAGIALEDGSPQHTDYVRINEVLAATSDKVKGWLVTGKLAVADAALGRADDVAALWSIFRARDAAWTQAEVLWSVRSVPRLRRRFVDSLDRFVGFAGRGMLFPAPDLQTPRH